MSYEVFKALHVLGVVLLLGNVTVTAVWKAFADLDGDPRVVAFSQRLVTITDFVFTLGGIALIYGGGFGAALAAGLDPFAPGWLLWSQVLFVASGVIWLGILVPIQIRQARLARTFGTGGEVPEAYWQASRRWLAWGIIATVPLVAAAWLMIVKP